MMEHDFSDNVREQIQNLETSEAEKLKLRRANGLFVAVRDGIVNLVNEKFGKKDSTKSIDKLGESGLALLHQAAQYGRTDIARSLLDNGAEIDVRTREDNLTPLHIATRLNCVETAKLLLQRGANPDLISTNGSTALHFAARRGNEEVAELLVNNARVDVNSKDSAHMTALHLACVSGNAAISKMLLKQGADIRAKSTELMTPLHTAVYYGNSEVVALILQAATEAREDITELLNDRDTNDNTVLHLAARTNDLHTANVCLQNGADINALNTYHKTPVYVATVKGNMQMVEFLVQKGADVNIKNTESKSVLHRAAIFNRDDIISFFLDLGLRIDTCDAQNCTPFLEAVAAGQTKCARLLLQRGADIEASDTDMKNCLHMAVENEHLETLNMLLKERSVLTNLYRPDVKERVPLHYAAMVKDVRIMEALLDKQTKVTFHDETQQTPLHLAALYGMHEQVEALARRMASRSGLNERDEQGKTPLHNAVINGNRKTCGILLNLGADLGTKDNNHRTPLMWASKLGREKACEELLNAQASVDDVNMNGDTALHVACRQGHVAIVNLLLTNGASLNVRNMQCLTCLETAAQAGNSEVALAMVKHTRWAEIMEHKDVQGHTPMKLIIEHFPESAELLMNRCVKRSDMTNSNDPEFTVTYDFHRLDPGPDDPAFLRGQRFFGPSTMVKYKRKKLLLHPLTQMLLNAKWSTFGRFIHYFNFLWYLVFVSLYSAFIILEREDFVPGRNMPPNKSQKFPHNALSHVVFTFTVVHLSKEILQISIDRFNYFTKISNLLEWGLYGTAFAFMIPFVFPDDITDKLFKGIKNPDHLWIVGVISISLCYVNLVLFLRRFRLFGIYVTMFLEVTQTVFRVLLVFFVLIVGFAIVFFVLFKEQLAFKNVGTALVKVLVMTIGEIDFDDTFIGTINQTSPSTGNPPNPFPDASFFFVSFFLLLMTIILMNLLVGLAVGDIDAIQQNATLKRLAMQVEFVAEVEDRYPRFITRRVYHPKLVVRPNYPTRWIRLMALLGMKNLFKQDFGLPAEEEHSHLSEDTDVRKELDKTKKRLKALVRASEVQIALLRGLARKIGSEIDEQSLDEISASMIEEQEALAQGVIDEELPPIEVEAKKPYTQKTYV